MLFHSQFFVLVFLPLAVLLYYAAARSAAGRQWVLTAVSLIFYGWWDARFIPLLIGQIAASWWLARLAERYQQRALLIAGIALNLCSLGTFKYLDFLLGNVEAITGWTLPRANLVLPIGISFFSFQLISYLVDRFRGQAPIYQFRPFALFVLLFPHLIAGPIVRHNELVPQFALDPMREGMWRRIAAGLVLFTIGFGKKVLLADELARIADPLFLEASRRILSFWDAWSAALAFSFQLFFDFSAYTEMAIGIALLFGLVLPENFRRPYLAVDIRDFWRRWHISLSNFLRDYLYIPLGGSRYGIARYLLATLITMGLCGLWHGAGWTFVAWGLWHGLGLIICHGWAHLHRPMPTALSWMVTMLFVIAGWVLFRAADFSTALSVLASMSGWADWGGALQAPGLLAFSAVIAIIVPPAHEIKDQVLRPNPIVAAAAAALGVICVLKAGDGALTNFIYFQF